MFDRVEEAESVVDGMVTAEVVGVLLVALAVMDVQGFAVGVRDQLRKEVVGNHCVWFADIVK